MLLFTKCSANDPAKIVIITDYGDIVLQLYDQTPQHRDNFIKLVKEGYYDGTLFHRVIKAFMIQGGDPDSKNANPGDRLGSGGPGYTIPAEFVPKYIHKRGALAAARTNNPMKASSGSQFYIVQGTVYNEDESDMVEVQIAQQYAQQMYFQYRREEQDAMQKAGQTVELDTLHARASRRASAWLRQNPYQIMPEDRAVYETIGGAPLLDGEYTVFGEVIQGMEVVEKIIAVDTDDNNRPIQDVKIKKMKVK
jgi:cyclophilin family peptidyl-prolyl cis-trans isomerase